MKLSERWHTAIGRGYTWIFNLIRRAFKEKEKIDQFQGKGDFRAPCIFIIGCNKSHWNDRCNRSRAEESCMWPTVFNHRHSSTGKYHQTSPQKRRREHRRRHAWRSTETRSTAERWFHRYGFLSVTAFPLFSPSGERQSRGSNARQNRTCTVGRGGNVVLRRNSDQLHQDVSHFYYRAKNGSLERWKTNSGRLWKVGFRHIWFWDLCGSSWHFCIFSKSYRSAFWFFWILFNWGTVLLIQAIYYSATP